MSMFHIKSFYTNSKIVIILSILIFIFYPTLKSNSEEVSKIIALVNGKPITQSDLQNRALYIKTNNQNLQDAMISNMAIDELINEAIQVTTARDFGITSSEIMIKQELDRQLKIQGTNLEEFTIFLESNNINPQTIIDQRTAATLWRDYILRKYRRLADITQEDIKSEKKNLISNETFHLQQLKINTSSSTKNFELAENIISNFESCAKNLSLFKDNLNIILEDMFDTKITNIMEPFASFLEIKYDQFILPIQNVDGEIIVMINCTPKTLPSDFEIENQLIGKQLEFFSEKELRNLRQDSIIDFKS